MRNITSPFFSTLVSAGTSWRRQAVIATVIIWMAVTWNFIQSYKDYEADQLKAEQHVGDVADEVIEGLEDRAKFAQLLVEAVRRENRGDLSGKSLEALNMSLSSIRQMFRFALKGNEIAIYNSTYRLLASTDNEFFQNQESISRPLQKRLLEPGASSTVYDLIKFDHEESAILLAHANRDREGNVHSIILVLLPTSILDSVFNVRRLGDDSIVTLVDKQLRLVKRQPPAPALSISQIIHPREQMDAGSMPGAYFVTSPFDHVERLVAMRLFKMVAVEDEMTLLVGVSRQTYLASWKSSMVINFGISVMLIIGWLIDITSRIRSAQRDQQLRQSSFALHVMIEQLPTPLALVVADNGDILHANPALLEIFGSLAAQGGKALQLFSENLVWEEIINQNDVVREVMSRHGKAFMRINSSHVGKMGMLNDDCCLIAFTDVTESYLREQRLETEATTDTLTGLANRRRFNEVAAQAVNEARIQQNPLSVIALDLDHFKRINDTYGHDAGDIVLTLASKLFQGALNPFDQAARMGGEEFAALLPYTTLAQAEKVAERIRTLISRSPVLLNDGQALSLTVSIGVSQLKDEDEDIESVLKRADKALYQAKETGRNRVVTCTE